MSHLYVINAKKIYEISMDVFQIFIDNQSNLIIFQIK